MAEAAKSPEARTSAGAETVAKAGKTIFDMLTIAEKNVVKEVIGALEEDGVSDDMIGLREVVITTMISKQRVDVAVKKYKAMLGIFREFGFSLKDLYDERKFAGEVSNHFANYLVCGKDIDGLRIMWIDGGVIPVEEEKNSVMAGMLYWMAVHSDITTLRNGITFVIDIGNKPDKTIGNERKLQATWQSMALRPQHIFIVGAGFFKRIVINGLIKFASLFTKSKIVRRIQFVEMETVHEVVPVDSRPDYDLPRSQRKTRAEAFVKEQLTIYPERFGAKNCLLSF